MSRFESMKRMAPGERGHTPQRFTVSSRGRAMHVTVSEVDERISRLEAHRDRQLANSNVRITALKDLKTQMQSDLAANPAEPDPVP